MSLRVAWIIVTYAALTGEPLLVMLDVRHKVPYAAQEKHDNHKIIHACNGMTDSCTPPSQLALPVVMVDSGNLQLFSRRLRQENNLYTILCTIP
jgi:hypothetical protein